MSKPWRRVTVEAYPQITIPIMAAIVPREKWTLAEGRPLTLRNLSGGQVRFLREKAEEYGFGSMREYRSWLTEHGEDYIDELRDSPGD